VTETTSGAVGAKGTGMAKRAAVASAVGTALEWIDFTIYGAVAATIFPQLFFSALDPAMGILAAFATFGVGFFARPLGGLFFGMLGDRIGRKNILLYTLSLMGVTSFLIGCLPTYGSVGLAAPIMLVTLRFLQGFALGGEATGAQLMTMEHAPVARRGLYGSFVNVGSSLAQVCANGMLFGLVALMGSDDFNTWGWRIPFLLSLVLVLVGLYIRRKVDETPAFEAAREKHVRVSAAEAFRRYPGTILRLLLIWCAPAACFYVINVFTLTYITRDLQLPSQLGFLCLMGANVVAAILMVCGGAFSDRVGRKPAMLLGASMMMVAALVYFPLLDTKSVPLIFLAIVFFVGSLQFQTGVQPSFFAEPFPTSVRYSGSAAAYTGSNLLAAGPTPFIAAWLWQASGGLTWSITLYCAAFILVSIIGILMSPETRGVDLTR
jgi:MFS family permease